MIADAGSPGIARAVMWRSSYLATALTALAVLPSPAAGAYFFLEQGAEKCYQVDMSEHAVVRIKYTMHDKEGLPAPGAQEGEEQGCKLEIKSPENQVVKDHAVTNANHEDTLAYLSNHDGVHHICITCGSASALASLGFGIGEAKKTRWTLAFDIVGMQGFSNTDASTFASRSHMDSAHSSVGDLVARMDGLAMESNYEKTFEAKFSRASNSVNTDVAAFKILQIFMISAVTALQIHILSTFFKTSCLDVISCLPFRQRQAE